MKMIKRTLILLIIATTVFTMVKCNRIEDADNIKQEQGNDTLPKDDKEDTDKKDDQDKNVQDKEEEPKEEEENKNDKQDKDKDDEPKEDQKKEEIKSPVELG